MRNLNLTRVCVSFLLTTLLVLQSVYLGAPAVSAEPLADTIVNLNGPTTLNPSFPGNGNECTSGWHYFDTVGTYSTLNKSSGDASNWAKWQPNLPISGNWKVEAYNPFHPYYTWPCSPYTYLNNDTNSAKYVVNYQGGSQTVVIEQQNSPGWVTIGVFNFSAGNSGYIFLGDVTGEGDYTRGVTFNGMRFTLQGSAIHGRITNADNGNFPLPGVTVSLNTGTTATTNSNGEYLFASVPGGTYTLTPSKSGFNFSPASLTVTTPPDKSGQNFSATPKSFFISGQVKDNLQNPVPNISIGIQGMTWNSSTTTDSNGYYVFSDLVAGIYDIKALTGAPYIFFPAFRRALLLLSSMGYQDFSTNQVYGNIQGTVKTEVSGTLLQNAIVTVAGKQVKTDAGGKFSLSNLQPGNVKISVALANYDTYNGTVNIQANSTITQNVSLKRTPSQGYYLPYPAGARRQVTCAHYCSEHVGKYQYSYDFGYWNSADEYEDLRVTASNDGIVQNIVDPNDEGRTAKYIRILHNDGTSTLYAHLARILVSVGQQVYRGQEIGVMGDTGVPGAVHLHFQRYNGWDPIETEFVEGGVLQTGESYTSQAIFTPTALNVTAGGGNDAIPPVGNVTLKLIGQANHYRLSLYAIDNSSGSLEMRLSSLEGDLSTTAWIPYQQELDWDKPVVFVQYKDSTGNISNVTSDWIDAIGYDPIAASFDVSSHICVNQDIQISNLTSPVCPQCSYQWNFGNEKLSPRMDPGFDLYGFDVSQFLGYKQAGQYTMSLSVSNYESTSTVSKSIQIDAAPNSKFDLMRVGNTIYVNAKDSNGTDWKWDFGDGQIGTGPSTSHTYASQNPQQYLVTLTITGANGCSSNGSKSAAGYIMYLPMTSR